VLLGAVAIAATAILPSVTPEAILRFVREGTTLDRFTLVLFLFFLVPPLFEGIRLPGALGLMMAGIALGPYGFAIADPHSPTVDLFSDLGRVFLMFIAGLEVDLRVFRATRDRSLVFGGATFLFPLLAGVLVARFFDFGWNAAFLIGSLIASHTLLAYPIIAPMGLARSEPVAVTLGATIFTDVSALLVLAVCVSVHTGGFTPLGLAQQLGQLAVYAVIVLIGFPWVGLRYFRRHKRDDMSLFLFTFFALLLAAMGAKLIHLEDIVGAFFAGLAVNRVVGYTSVREKVDFLGTALVIPAFFMALGARLDLPVFGATIVTSIGFVAAIVAALFVAKLLAAGTVRAVYRYGWPETLTTWSLSLPQVAATLAAAVVAYNTVNAEGDRLITETVMNGVIVLMVLTSVLGPILTERFARRLPTQEGEDATT
jgi:Kef-type K+ transport system membrane component KefB